MDRLDRIVVVFYVTDHPQQFCSAFLYVVPGFARHPLLGADEVVIEATRSFLYCNAKLHVTVIRPYKRVKRFEKEGASCYAGLPRDTPCALAELLVDPCVAYTAFAIMQMRVLLGRDFLPAEIMNYAWGMDVPHSCRNCDDELGWAMFAAYHAVCVTCGSTHMHSAFRM